LKGIQEYSEEKGCKDSFNTY